MTASSDHPAPRRNNGSHGVNLGRDQGLRLWWDVLFNKPTPTGVGDLIMERGRTLRSGL